MRYYVGLYGFFGFLQGSVEITSDMGEGETLKAITDITQYRRDFSTSQAIEWWQSRGLQATPSAIIPSGRGYAVIRIQVHTGKTTRMIVPEEE